MKDEKSKALDYLENIISSMREASFKCKEFCIIICSAFLTVFATVDPTPKMMVILCSPIVLLFWILDSCYLAKERKFKAEFKRIALLSEEDLSKENPLLFSVKTGNFFKFCGSVIKAMFNSFSTVLLYGCMFGASLGFGIYLLNS